MPEDKKIRVLLVEDDKFMVRMYQVRLSAEGYQVETALNGDECLDMANQFPPDIILLDLNLPLMDGFVVLEKLKGSQNTSSVPVIVFSNRSTPDDISRAMKLGAEDFLVKVSTRPEEVIRKIDNALRKVTGKPGQPKHYLIAIDWNALDAKKMAEELGIPVEYRSGRCITEMHFEAIPEYSHNEPWIMGKFVPKKKH